MNRSDAYFIRELAYHLTLALQQAVYQLHSVVRDEEDMRLYKRYLIYVLQQNGGELVVDRDAAEVIDPEGVRIIREFSGDGKMKLKLGRPWTTELWWEEASTPTKGEGTC